MPSNRTGSHAGRSREAGATEHCEEDGGRRSEHKSPPRLAAMAVRAVGRGVRRGADRPARISAGGMAACPRAAGSFLGGASRASVRLFQLVVLWLTFAFRHICLPA